jgi:hypothetical protein
LVLVQEEMALLRAWPKNKVRLLGVFLATIKHAANSPRSPRKSLQLHQQNTTPKHTNPQKPLQKQKKVPPPTTPRKYR